MNKYYQYYTVNQHLRTKKHYESILLSTKNAWDKVQELDKQIESENDVILKDFFRKEKNAICKEQEGHLLSNCQMTSNEEKMYGVYRQAFVDYRLKFFQADEDGALVEYINKYAHLKSSNESESKMLLDIKNTCEGLKEHITKSMNDKNISPEIQQKMWNLPFYDNFIKQVINYETIIKNLQQIVLTEVKKCSFGVADYYNQELEKEYKKIMQELRSNSILLVKTFVYTGLLRSGRLYNSDVLEVTTAIDEFKRKMDDKFAGHNIHDKIKSDVFQVFDSEIKAHLKQIDDIGKNIKQVTNGIYQSPGIIIPLKNEENLLKTQYKKLKTWKTQSESLIEKITSKAIDFSYKMPHLQSNSNVPNQQTNLPNANQMQTLIDQIAKLNETLAQMNLGNIDIPPLTQVNQNNSDSFDMCDQSMNSISQSLQNEG